MEFGPAFLGSVVLFALGIFMLLTRRNAVVALIGVELILNAANINFVTFSQQLPNAGEGTMAALFGIVLAAAEAAVGLAIILNLYNRLKTVELDDIDNLKG